MRAPARRAAALLLAVLGAGPGGAWSCSDLEQAVATPPNGDAGDSSVDAGAGLDQQTSDVAYDAGSNADASPDGVTQEAAAQDVIAQDMIAQDAIGDSPGDEADAPPMLAADPVFRHHPTQPMVVDVELTFTAPATASLGVVQDVGIRIAPLDGAAPALSHTYRLRGLQPATSYSLAMTVAWTAGRTEVVTPVPFSTLAPLVGFDTSVFSVAGAGSAASPYRMFDVSPRSGGAGTGLWVLEPPATPRWYCPHAAAIDGLFGSRLLDGGASMFLVDHDLLVLDELCTEIVRLVGSTIAPGGLHHDATRLPSGNFLALARTFRRITYPILGEIDVAGDLIVELTPSGQKVWEWDAFDHLDPQRTGDPYFASQRLRDPGTQEQAYDWTHANSIQFVESDQTILISMRHQSWILKIDRATGAIVWKLGEGGDFALAASDSWFHGQHAAQLLPDGSVVLYDNGLGDPGADASVGKSRALRMSLDAAARTAAIVWRDDRPISARFGGDCTTVANGYLVLDSTIPLLNGGPSDDHALIRELDPAAANAERWRLTLRDGVGSWRANAYDRLPGEAAP